jgi:hypothetical protein
VYGVVVSDEPRESVDSRVRRHLEETDDPCRNLDEPGLWFIECETKRLATALDQPAPLPWAREKRGRKGVGDLSTIRRGHGSTRGSAPRRAL